jgi:NADP-dependent 3-hydroxy acid dehydrogenase YdfG
MDSGGGPGFLLEHRIGGTLLLQTDDGTAVSNLFSNSARLGQWTQFCCTVTNSGTNLEWFMNGVSVASSTVTARDVTNTAAVLRIGEKVTESRPMDGSFALIRISGTVPSPEQIKKIYEDEKFLFQENAKATLYGTSDAVTALAYDDDTELLHVGTSAGRSVFQGLTRIDNTTDAVGSAISASNGLVAED